MRRSMAVGVTMLVAGCSSGSPPPKQPAVIDPNAVITMTQASFPQMYERLGAADFARANILSHAAARKAAADGGCDRVDSVGVSDSSLPGAIQFFVDCKNGERRRYGEEELG